MVDDDIVVRSAVAEYLRSAGNDVVEAGNAAEAVAVFAARVAIDAVFSDVKMPGPMDGIGLARWLREHYPGVRVGLTSGATHGTSAARVAEIFVPKPYQAAEVAERVRDMIAGAGSPAAPETVRGHRGKGVRPRRDAGGREPEPVRASGKNADPTRR